ncbi:DUF968 domain-containing protein [Providencia sp. PROV259]|uniref:DUF968 domain-containing protein n=1 Tax=Providencia sp. PROV259 TaxID=2949947 RepID=UPI0023499B4C|nr:DUF968 domain-containing protein [Providencia sp. PROV259]
MHKASILTANTVPDLGLVIFRPGVGEVSNFNGRMLIIPVPNSLNDKSVGPISLSSSFLSDEFSDIEEIKQILKLHIDPEPPASFMKKPKLLRWTNDNYLQWVKKQPCCICNAIADDAHHLIGYGQGGTGTKAHDLFTIPLCRIHHSELHKDQNGWEREHGSQLIFLIRFLDRSAALGVFG